MDGSSLGSHLLLKVLKRSELLGDERLQLSIWKLASAFFCWSQVEPPEGVIDVTCSAQRKSDRSYCVSFKGRTDVHDTLYALVLTTTIELDSSLRSNGSLDVILGKSIGESFLCSIQVGDVGVVVLAMVQLHNLGSDVWLKSIVRVWQVWKRVLERDSRRGKSSRGDDTA